MAGAGTRFIEEGYTLPKPLIDVNNKPMIQLVLENINIDAQYVFIVQKEHCEKYDLHKFLSTISPNCKIVQLDSLTEGACCTTMLAKEFIDNDQPLLIVNSDQYINWDKDQFLSRITDDIDGCILTIEQNDPAMSYVKLADDGYAIEVAEKRVISNLATVGAYYWSKGSEYTRYAEWMIKKNIRTNNEFYIAPVYNEAIAEGKKIASHLVEDMWILGTPKDLNHYLNRK